MGTTMEGIYMLIRYIGALGSPGGPQRRVPESFYLWSLWSLWLKSLWWVSLKSL
jgi:hypothetical protein